MKLPDNQSLNHLQVGIYQTDPRGSCTYVNQEWLRFAGMVWDDALGDGWLQAIYEEDRDKVFAAWNEAVKSRQPFQLQYRFQNTQGELFWVLGKAQEILDDQGVLLGYIGSVTDISELVQLHSDMQEKNELLERIFDNPHALIAYMDTDFKFIEVNAAYASMDNKTPGFFAGKNHFELYPNAENQQLFQSVLESGEPYFAFARPFEYEYNPDKTITHWDWSLWPIRDTEGEISGVLLVLVDVTQRVEAEQQLLIERNFSAAILQSAHALVVVLDRFGRVEKFNKACESATGFSADETLGQFVWEILIPPEQVDVVKGVFHALEHYKTTGTFSNHWLCKDNSRRLINWNNSVILDDNGEVSHVVSVGVDITEREQIQHDLRIYRHAIHTAVDPIVLGDVRGHVTYCNDAFIKLWGYHDAAEVIGVDGHSYWNYQNQDEVTRALKAHGHWVGEGSGIRSDGSEFPVRMSVVMIRNEEGLPLSLMATMQDLSEEVSIREELSRKEETLKKAQSIAHVGSWDWDIVSGELSWSDEIYRIFGLLPQEFAATYEAFLKTIHEDDRQSVMDAVNESINEEGRSYSIEHRIVRPSGEERVVYEQGKAYFDDGKPVRMIGTVLDVTERKRAEGEIIKLNRELEQRVAERTQELQHSLKQIERENIERRAAELDAKRANEMKTEFLNRVSHEFRTPLNAILGFTDLLLDDDLNESQQDFLGEVRKAGTDLLHMINEVLDLGKIESGDISIEKQAVDVYEVCRDAINLVSAKAVAAKVDIELGPVSRECVAIGDHGRIKEVLVNFLSNAVKYGADGGRVLLECQPMEEGKLQISVSDFGVGLSAEDAQRVFEPFNRLGAEYTSIEGTGLGLSIAKRLIHLMDGEIGVNSKPGEGCRFWFELPAEQRSKGVLVMTEKQQESVTFSAEQRTILYVEDNLANFKLVEQVILRNRPAFKVLHTVSAEEGLTLARKGNIDLIIMDINLPGMDGYEALARLRNIPGARDIPVIALSASAMPKDVERGLLAGFRRYVTKPLQKDDLLDAVDSQLPMPQLQNTKDQSARSE